MMKQVRRHDRRAEQIILRIMTAISAITIIILLMVIAVIVKDYTGSIDDDKQIIMSRDWGYDESESLAQLAMAMAADQDKETKMLVMLVALNRVWSDGFPRNVEKVVADMAGEDYDQVVPDDECYKAEARVHYEGWDKSRGALYCCRSGSKLTALYDLAYRRLYTSGDYIFYR
ncbi:MAG: cell wall hydrolase [Bacteroidales bacterium]|nr:cell wall hydrolase [Bacteroidales bacterium]